MHLNEKVSLITGGGMGIGRAIALLFAQAGSVVYVVDNNEEAAQQTVEIIRSQGGQAFPFVVDVTSERCVNAALNEILRSQDRIDILVHCAAVQYAKDFYELTARQWKKVINVNLFGTFCVCRAVAARMEKQDMKTGDNRGKIITLSSIHDIKPRLGKFDYDAAKAGVAQFTRELALLLAPLKINVNAISPGAIRTPMNQNLETDLNARTATVAKIPWGRMGEADEVAQLALFLASDLSGYITGCIIPIDGGRSLYNG
jgi:glucose 1-dehydrogenase